MEPLRVMIVSENISMKMGGESSLPFFYAKLFSQKGVEVWLSCHGRVGPEVISAFPELKGRIRLVHDTQLQKFLSRFGTLLPYRIRDLLIEQAIHFSTQSRIRKIVVELAVSKKIDVILEAAPISPKGLSFMHGIAVPVVIGPLCGGMNFPPAFAEHDSLLTRIMVELGRYLSNLANKVVPGKLNASVLLVANQLTAEALPVGYRGQVKSLFESGVDLDFWKPAAVQPNRLDDDVIFAFSGRFVDWKGIRYLLAAFARVVIDEPRCRLELIGGGELEGEVRSLISRYNLSDNVKLRGWLNRLEAAEIIRGCDAFVMPSLRECGGTAILEAMALGKPVIATKWGGPAEYVDASCGILVEPSSKQKFIENLADAMVRMARSPDMRAALGEGGKLRVRKDGLDWNSKADRVLAILREAVSCHAP